MKAHLSGSDLAADVVRPTPTRTTKTEPIAIDGRDAGPTHADLALFDRLHRRELDLELEHDQATEADHTDLDSGLDLSAGLSAAVEPLILSNRYRLIRRLGSGGMGVVYLAEQIDRGDHPVAIKVLDASTREWCHTIDRFLWEARLCSRIRHPNVVSAYEYGSTPRGIVYMVMELLDGQDLKAVLREKAQQAGNPELGRLSWRWTRYVMRQVCAGVDALHRAGIVHRDLKASNCFYVRRNATIKIIDLGIATFEDPLLTAPGMGGGTGGDRTIVGTPEYMAPEQIRGAPVDRRADVYSAGILLHELLTGRTPFGGQTTEAVFKQHLELPAPQLERAQSGRLVVPAGIDAILAKALAKRPGDRYANMPELAAALERLP